MNVSEFLTSRSTPALEHIAAGLDQAYLDNVRDTFGGWGINPLMVDIIIWTGIAVCFTAGIGILLNEYVFKRRPSLPGGTVVDAAEIAALLHLALDQRSKIEFSFSRDDQAARALHCGFEDIRNETLILDAGGFATAHQGWLGRPVTCYFHIFPRTKSKQPRFYTFESEVSGVVKRRDGDIQVAITMPQRLSLQQKRIHLRMEPPMDCLLGLAMWPEPLADNGSPQLAIKKFGKPMFVYHEGKTRQIRVINLSAGGMRVEISSEAKRMSKLQFEMGERYLVLFKLRDPESNTADKLWCMTRVQNRYEDFETRSLELGLHFKEIGIPTDEVEPQIVWKKIGSGGIQDLGNWIQRRHLELFREKGIV